MIYSLATLIRQRVVTIACGDEDQADADTLGTDPLLKLVCGRLPDGGVPLASQPTMRPKLPKTISSPSRRSMPPAVQSNGMVGSLEASGRRG